MSIAENPNALDPAIAVLALKSRGVKRKYDPAKERRPLKSLPTPPLKTRQTQSPFRTLHCNDGRLPSDAYWFRTFMGKRFNLLRPRVADVDIVDIGVALSRIARFGGHTREPYSVAQHSVLVSEIRPTLAALLHDAAEAYIGDLITPFKRLMPQVAWIEGGLLKVIGEALGVDSFDDPLIKQADLIALATERRDLCMGSLSPWSIEMKPRPERLVAWTSPDACFKRFMDRYHELKGGRHV